MIRELLPHGWRLISHQDHARLAGKFASCWGNDLFLSPQPRDEMLTGIACHDDGWVTKDRFPTLARSGKPGAFSHELVGKYSAFEEIDLDDYLSVRGRALEEIADRDPFAAVLVSSHTLNLLTERADYATIRDADLPKLKQFILIQQERQNALVEQLRSEARYPAPLTDPDNFLEGFKLLQACDCLSLLTCVNWRKEADLLHSLSCTDGLRRSIQVRSLGQRHFQLKPYPFMRPELSFSIPSKVIPQVEFTDQSEFAAAYAAAPVEELSVQVC